MMRILVNACKQTSKKLLIGDRIKNEKDQDGFPLIDRDDPKDLHNNYLIPRELEDLIQIMSTHGNTIVFSKPKNNTLYQTLIMPDSETTFGFNHDHFLWFLIEKNEIIGLNPGGDPEQPETIQYLPQEQIEAGRCEYYENRINSHYLIAVHMVDYLKEALDLNNKNYQAVIESIPVTNLVFHRSRHANAQFIKQKAPESKPFLEEIIKHVDPSAILFLSIGAFDHFIRLYVNPKPNVGIQRFYRNTRGYLPILQHEVDLIAIAHPSSTHFRAGDREAIKHKLEQDIRPLYIKS